MNKIAFIVIAASILILSVQSAKHYILLDSELGNYEAKVGDTIVIIGKRINATQNENKNLRVWNECNSQDSFVENHFQKSAIRGGDELLVSNLLVKAAKIVEITCEGEYTQEIGTFPYYMEKTVFVKVIN